MRYTTVAYGDGVAIHDSVTNRFIGNGKGEVLCVTTFGEALDVIDIMVQRVGA
jgi:hypothetical protein